MGHIVKMEVEKGEKEEVGRATWGFLLCSLRSVEREERGGEVMDTWPVLPNNCNSNWMVLLV